MTQSKWVRVGSVRRFDHVEQDEELALKPLVEASEVHGAWQAWRACEGRSLSDYARDRLLDSCADVIQATLNLVAAFGVEDFRPWMNECEKRNQERGRITK